MGSPKSLQFPIFEPQGEPIRLGVSSCLLGNPVRWDGDDKRDAFVAEALGAVFELVPICPEVAIGLGVPRSPIRLVAGNEGVRAKGVDNSGLDATDRLAEYGRAMAKEHANICGYILKSESPSCGMDRVKVFRERGGLASRRGTGIYAQAFMEARPELPFEEEGRLNDMGLRENFVERVFAFHRWQLLNEGRITRGKLVAFHSAHKLSLMAHGIETYRALGRLVARADEQPLEALADLYLRGFMAALRRPATRRLHANVLNHLAGYLKRVLDSGDRQELADVITDYRIGNVPLLAPITLLRHHFRRHPRPYVERQVYLKAHPTELMLRGSH
jgi:uncharacterized protein YbgA (DUF1722 family)/uncharacterized protein YbbK (DUF523 family)